MEKEPCRLSLASGQETWRSSEIPSWPVARTAGKAVCMLPAGAGAGSCSPSQLPRGAGPAEVPAFRLAAQVEGQAKKWGSVPISLSGSWFASFSWKRQRILMMFCQAQDWGWVAWKNRDLNKHSSLSPIAFVSSCNNLAASNLPCKREEKSRVTGRWLCSSTFGT